MTKPFVSVIIPVYNDPERLKLCLDALSKQTYPHDSYEVIVVDNNSDFIPDNVISQFPNVIMESEQKQGAAAARNKGISVAKGEILAFTDADCIPDNQWLENGVKCLNENPDCGLAGGRIIPFPEDPCNMSAAEMWETRFSYNQERNIKRANFASTSNVFIFRSIIQKTGGFNDNLKASEDFELGKRIHELGYKLIYCKDASVSHPARKSLIDFCKRQMKFTKGRYSLYKLNLITRETYMRNALLSFVPPILSVAKILTNHNNRHMGVKAKLKFIGLFLLRRYLIALQKVKLLIRGC